MMGFTKQVIVTALFWIISSFCLGWVAIFWGRWFFFVGLIVAVSVGATMRWAMFSFNGSLAVTWRVLIDLFAIGLMSFGWIHVLVRYFMNI